MLCAVVKNTETQSKQTVKKGTAKTVTRKEDITFPEGGGLILVVV